MSKSTHPFRLDPWPWGIISAFAVFIAMSVTVIVVSRVQPMELVSDDYYEQEIQYQAQIDRMRRAQGLSSEVAFIHDPDTANIRIVLPPEHRHEELTGNVHFYRPSAAQLDRKFAIRVDENGEQRFSVDGMAAGLWVVRVFWRIDDREYYADRRVVLPVVASIQ